ncbi:MAG: ureidoglycolate lyase [Rhodobacteraceae bacterium]|nr:ureidoglycolate lyase [Paracoccaceae bacterium]
MTKIAIEPLTSKAFAPFGDILQATGEPTKIINQGKCGRWHDLATLDFAEGRAGISLFRAVARAVPFAQDLVERHPEGSQAFVPMSEHPWLVIVAEDIGGQPGRPSAFEVPPHTGINFHRGTWHGVLTPLHAPGLFAVIDRIGTGDNLEEFYFPKPYIVG